MLVIYTAFDMKKLWSVLLSILLGAFVVGIGTGYFLYLANKDRQALAQEANQAKLEAQQALSNSQAAIEEANLKLAKANEQVTNAQQALEALRTEQALLKSAEPLLKPPSKTLDGWSSAISTPFGISILYPPGSDVISDNEKIFAIANSTVSSTSWIKIIPFSEVVHNGLSVNITSSTQISYFIDGKLVAGIVGTDKNSNTETALLKIYENGSSTQSIWLQNPPSYKLKPWLKDQNISYVEILKTLEFKK
jgi:archaellum component FlaF (FlaF/FlaG flagellin family)